MSTHRFTIADTALIPVLRDLSKAPALREKLPSTEPDHFIYRAFKEDLKRLLGRRDSFPDDHRTHEAIDELYVNIERWRWEFQGFPDRYLFLNIPSGKLYLFHHDAPVFCTEAVGGTGFHPLSISDVIVDCMTIRETGDAEITISSKVSSDEPWISATLQHTPNAVTFTRVQQSLQIKGGARLAALLDPNFPVQKNREWILDRPVTLFVRYYTFDRSKRYADIHNIHEGLRQAIQNPPFSIEPEDFISEPVSPSSGDL